jgi:hypothetical protein
VFLITTALLAVIPYFHTATYGIVLHEGYEPGANWADRPANTVVGRWSTNASFVVVAPRWIITTCHQNTNPATVDINNTTYNCIYNAQWMGGPTGKVDMRLIRLKNLDGSDPNLAYAPPYTVADEMSQPIVIGGYGRGRENMLIGDTQRVYGYTWSTSTQYNNATLRWCTNRIVGSSVSYSGSRISNVISAAFDDPFPEPDSTLYEGIPAEYDSGGGWFIKVGNSWKTAGLTRGIAGHGEPWPTAGQSWYRDQSYPDLKAPDSMDAVRISSYAVWIKTTITAADCNGLIQGDLNSDCKVDFVDFALFANQWLRRDCGSENKFCNGADLLPDTTVDLFDLIIVAQNWLADKSLSLL